MEFTKKLEKKERIIGFVLISFLLFISGLLGYREGWTTDEPVYLIAGKGLIERGFEWKYIHEKYHGPIPYLANQIFVGDFDPIKIEKDQDPITRFKARLGMLLFLLILSISVWGFAREAWGIKGGLISLFFLCFSPTFISRGPLLCPDVAFSAFSTLTIWFFWRWLKKTDFKNLFLWASFSGIMLATKYSSFLLIIPLPIISLISEIIRKEDKLIKRLFNNTIISIFIAGFISMIFLHASYLFKAPMFSEYDTSILKSGVFSFLFKMPILKVFLSFLPAPLVIGADYQNFICTCSNDSVFMDFFGGHWAYYFVSILTKTPLPTIIVLLLSFLTIDKEKSKRPFIGLTIWVPFSVLLFYMSFINKHQNGIRYILPGCALLFVWMGRSILFLEKANKFIKFGWWILPIWLVIIILAIWPYYHGYFNVIIGGPRYGYKFFADANCDFQQFYEEGREVIKKKYPDIKIIGQNDGPRFGTIGIYTNHIKPRDPENPNRVYHWISKFKPVDNISSVWLVFSIKPKYFIQKIAEGYSRSGKELCIAWLGELNYRKAEVVFNNYLHTKEYRDIKRTIELLKKRDYSNELVKLFLKLKRLDSAFEVIKRSKDLKKKDFALDIYKEGWKKEALSIYKNAWKRRELNDRESLKYVTLLLYEFNFIEAYNVFNSINEPKENTPIYEAWKGIKKLVNENYKKYKKIINIGNSK